MRGVWILVGIFICQCWYGYGKNGKFEVLLDNITECRDPQPLFPKKPLLKIKIKLSNLKDGKYITGSCAVLQKVSFNNLKLTTFSVDDSGRQQLKFSVEKLTCRSLSGQVILGLTDIKYTRNTCQLTKGNSTFKEIDINKISHRLPTWHAVGTLMHRVHLVDRGYTVFCYDVLVTVREV